MDRPQTEAEKRKNLEAKLSALGGEQQERLAQQRADTLRLPYITLVAFPIDPDVLELVPKDIAEQSQAVLFFRQGKDIRLGAVNPSLPAFKKIEQFVTETFTTKPQTYVISHRSFATALARYRRAVKEKIVPRDELRVENEATAGSKEDLADLESLGAHITQLSPTELLSTIAAGAVKLGASDIHIEPITDGARLRYRIDGVLEDVTTFARSGWRLLLSRVKVMAKLKINIRNTPQDGSFVLRLGSDVYDVRVSTLPGREGENIVMRLLNRSARVRTIAELGMKERDEAVVRKALKQSNGMILVTGPTGSGKTTSLASFIGEVNDPELKIITLEDPIEYRTPGVEQTQVDASAGYTFAKGLRAILRQDPDIVMVGEIRDSETASTALHAALTGHLVFTTLHTNNAPDAVVRLIDLDIQPNIIAPAINLIIAQRLVRVVCQECVEKYTPKPSVLEHIADAMAGVARDVFDPAGLKKKDLQFARAKGCQDCRGTGYRGRIGIYEVMPVSGQVEELILQGANSNRLREAALASGMTTILQDGYLKVLTGVTTIEELERVTEE